MKAANKAGLALTVAVVLVGLGLTVSLWAFRQVQRAEASTAHADRALARGFSLLSTIADAETGQRGYLLTGDETFLEPYLTARSTVFGQLHELRALTTIASAQPHLDALSPLIDGKFTESGRLIAMRRQQDIIGAHAAVAEGQGKRLMDSIRSEIGALVKLEQIEQARLVGEYHASMSRLLLLISLLSLLALLFAIAYAVLLYRQTQQQLKAQVLTETGHLLTRQAATNQALEQANAALRIKEENLAVTLRSIGDAVIATDAQARVTLMNPVAEQLTGWSYADAAGRTIDEVFHIINKETRQPATIPVAATLAHGTVQGLANHTVLIPRVGRECDVADSCAPICGDNGQVIGAVLVFRNVTSEYVVQQALRASEERANFALQMTHTGGWDLNLADQKAQQTVEHARIFGYADIPPNWTLDLMLEHVLAEDRAEAARHFREAIAFETDLAFECRIRRVDGVVRWLAVAGLHQRNLAGDPWRMAGVVQDITPRKLAEAALLEAGALQNAIFNSANFSSIATDARGVIQIFNVGAERMLGYSAADVMNRVTPAEISDPQEVIRRAQALSRELNTDIAPGFEALVFKASRGIEDIYELTYIRKDGSRFPAVVSVTALRDAGDAIIGYLLIGTDNTARQLVEEERKRLDQALQQNNLELQSAKSAAEKANLAKSDFLSSMSHELRSPLNAILGFAQLMESGSPPPTPLQKANIKQILQAGWYLLELINEVLDLALIESGKLSLSLERTSLTEVLADCHAMIEPQARNSDIKLNFPVFDEPCYVRADRTRMKQLFINLLSNAIKYNRVGGEVEVTCTASADQRIRVSFRDTGHGLTPDELGQLFQPFNRLGQASGNTEGTGIGLVVCKRLVDLMEGAIGVQSTAGVGSTFWVELNADAAPTLPAPMAAPKAVNRVPAAAGSSMRTLLYVEDNPANLLLVAELVARRPEIHLLSATDGSSGVDLARAAQPDVILMDINLPGISGLQALKILSEDPSTERIPIIALSANAMPRDVEKGLAAGFFRYLTKPIKIDEFMDTLDEAMQHALTQPGDTAKEEQAS